MAESKGGKPAGRWPADPSPAPKQPAPETSKPPEPPRAGRVVHDSRGTAVWDWLKETSRIAIESTSALLKRLEMPPDVKVEAEEDTSLRLESDRQTGGGYDPYNQVTQPKRKPPDPK